jgi:hypothetical protein
VTTTSDQTATDEARSKQLEERRARATRLEERRRERLRRAWEEVQASPSRAAFLATYGVKPYKHEYRNMRALLLQGGAGDAEVKRVLDRHFGPTPKYGVWLGDRDGKGQVFDHPEFYGRGRVPLFLVGHPYNVAPDADPPCVSEDAAGTIEALRSLGMTVVILHPGHSWYGWGSRQVVVYHLPTVRRVCGEDAPEYPFLDALPRKPWPGLEAAERELASTFPQLVVRRI